MILIRRAKTDLHELKRIHDVHMNSIREFCSKDYTPEQIQAWAGRAFSEEARRQTIVDDDVFVIKIDRQIEGFAHVEKNMLRALYFSGIARGRGLGKSLMKEIEALCKEKGFIEIMLESTLSSLEFYKKLGFIPGEPTTHPIQGVPIPCVPMRKML